MSNNKVRSRDDEILVDRVSTPLNSRSWKVERSRNRVDRVYYLAADPLGSSFSYRTQQRG